jgi:hypothetical protein
MSAYRITREHVWVCVIDDQPGALADKLRGLSASGVNLELIITRREKHGRALMFVSPLRSEAEISAARKNGLAVADSLRNLRFEGPNAIGLGARMTGVIEEAGINLRGFSAASLGEMHVTNLAFDSDEDLQRAKDALEAEFSA